MLSLSIFVILLLNVARVIRVLTEFYTVKIKPTRIGYLDINNNFNQQNCNDYSVRK